MQTLRLVLLPGMDGTGILFEPLLRVLPARLIPQVVAYSGREPRGYAELVDVVEAVLPKEPFVLLGESFSGPLALMLARRQPAALRAVILCASFATNPVAWLPFGLAQLARAPLFALVPDFVRNRSLLGSDYTPALGALLSHAHTLVTGEVLAARARAILQVDVMSDVSACPVPLLYLCGLHDRVVPRAASRAILRARPDTALVELPGPHLLLQTHPAAAASEIERWLAQLPASGSVVYRVLEPHESDRLGTLDRSEHIDGNYRFRNGALELDPMSQQVPTWGDSELALYVSRLQALMHRNGVVFSAWVTDALIGIASLDTTHVGGNRSVMNLDMLYVSAKFRGRGVARELARRVEERARELGATQLYISATPTRRTVDFYLRRGAAVLASPDPTLFAREPDDIHLMLEL
jgi:pimeloyl-[acyl-carrier protein] methyl ester esterase